MYNFGTRVNGICSLIMHNSGYPNANVQHNGNGGPLMRLYIENLPSRSYTTALEDWIGRYGEIRSLEPGYRHAYVEMAFARDCTNVINNCNGKLFMGNRIRVKFDVRDNDTQYEGVPMNHTCQVCGGVGHEEDVCPSRRPAIAANRANTVVGRNTERHRVDRGGTISGNFSAQSRHSSDEVRTDHRNRRRPLSEEYYDHRTRHRDFHSRFNSNHQTSNRHHFERRNQRDSPMNSRSIIYSNSESENRDHRDIPDGPQYSITRSSSHYFNQQQPYRSGRRSSLQDYQRSFREGRPRSQTPPPRGPARRSRPPTHSRPYEEEEERRNGSQDLAPSTHIPASEDRISRRSISPRHQPRLGPRSPPRESN
ncbi:hypothetical protein BGW37DRAFT_526425 [Umbelopsis sp. PMI_123]|nr:hypothetical protein BGW37DRAFT_526425 [Umbelopsis sp. PMI_123]